MTEPLIYAVITTHNRQELLTRQVLPALGLPAPRVFVIDNASTPPVTTDLAVVIRDNEQPPNLSRLWNRGLAAAAVACAVEAPDPADPYAVLVLNDDVIMPPAGAVKLHAALRATGATIAFPDQHRRGTLRRTSTDGLGSGRDLYQRMTGYCWMVDGRAGLRLDERFRWWCGDDDIERQAITDHTGTVLVDGVTVQHLHADQSTQANPLLLRQCSVDKDAFIEKWGVPPW